jgi:hypothetical protein
VALCGADPELVMFDWNQPITTAQNGFPRDLPPQQGVNGDWTSPINYADGTLYLRAEIQSGGQPVPKPIMIGYCIWQDDLVGYSFGLEECVSLKGPLQGIPGESLTWEHKVNELNQISQNPLDWTRARHAYGVAIKNTAGIPVSGYGVWDWDGGTENEWYPLDMRITVVAVPYSQTFSGWSNYP